MKILVMGAGALGSCVGGFMALAGHEVTLLGRAAHMNAIAEQGLHITGIWGEHVSRQLCVCTDLSEGTREYDLIVVAVKSYDTASVIRQIAPLVGGKTLVCMYQNGLGNAEEAARQLGWERVLGARVIYGARITRPGEVDITVIAEPTAIGAYDIALNGETALGVAAAMNDAGLPTVATDAIESLLWNKVAYNCALNPLSALLDVPYGVLAEAEDTREIMNGVVHELYSVAAAVGVTLQSPDADAYLKRFYDVLLPPTAAHYASMREDLIRGRRTEIDALNGAIVRFGVEHGIACPTNRVLTALIRARERQALPRT